MHLDELASALRELGHEIIVVGPAAIEKGKFGADAGAVAWMKKNLPSAVYEILEFGYSFWDYWRLRKAISVHRPDCLYERYNLFLPSGVWIKRRFHLPMLLEVNAPLLEERHRYSGLSLLGLARWSQDHAWRGADYVLPVTRVLAEKVRQRGVPDSRVVVIPNGVNLRRFAERLDRAEAKRRLGLETSLVLGFAGFVREWHGMEQVIRLIADTKSKRPLHLLLVGDGPARENLESLARSLGVTNRLTVTGVCERDHIAQYLAAFDVALQPSVVDYASPLKLFEYMAMGCAIVAPAKPNIQEILTHERDALLFDPNQPGALRQALERICEDSILRERISRQAAETIHERHFTWENNAQRIVSLFAALGVKDSPSTTRA